MDNKLLLIVVAVLLPPVAVFLKKGVSRELAINIALSLLFYLPGVIHACWLVTR